MFLKNKGKRKGGTECRLLGRRQGWFYQK